METLRWLRVFSLFTSKTASERVTVILNQGNDTLFPSLPVSARRPNIMSVIMPNRGCLIEEPKVLYIYKKQVKSRS